MIALGSGSAGLVATAQFLVSQASARRSVMGVIAVQQNGGATSGIKIELTALCQNSSTPLFSSTISLLVCFIPIPSLLLAVLNRG